MKPVFLAFVVLMLTSACVQPASATQIFREQNPFTPEAIAQLCTAADLQTSSSANNEAGILIIGVTLINQSQNRCNLQPVSQVSLYHADQRLNVDPIQMKADAPTLGIAPGESVILALGWRNYCGENKTHPEIHLPLTKTETLKIKPKLPALPRCEDSQKPSTLTIHPYTYPP